METYLDNGSITVCGRVSVRQVVRRVDPLVDAEALDDRVNKQLARDPLGTF